MKNKITSFILTDFGWFKFWLTDIFKITLLASSPDLSESIYVVEIRLSHTPLDPANTVNFFSFSALDKHYAHCKSHLWHV